MPPTSAGPPSGGLDEIRLGLFGDRPLDSWPPPRGVAPTRRGDGGGAVAEGGGDGGGAVAEGGGDGGGAVAEGGGGAIVDGGEDGEETEPWRSFVAAREHLAAGDPDLAIRRWGSVANPLAGHETRHVLQAWHFLRVQNVHPDPSIAHEVLGIVAEVAVGDGHDVLAAYADGSVRFLHHQGGATFIEPLGPGDAGDDRGHLGEGQTVAADAVGEVRRAARAWLAVGQEAHDAIGPWEGGELPDLPPGHTRHTMLTLAGPRFGQGPHEALATDPLGASLLAAASVALAAVVDLT